jgi:hypothetical protein
MDIVDIQLFRLFEHLTNILAIHYSFEKEIKR